MPRKLLMGLGIMAALLAMAVGALLSIDVDSYRPRVQALVAGQLKRSVSLGRLEVSLWPVGVRVQQAVIGDDPAFQTSRPFARAARLIVRPRLLPLLTGSFELTSLELEQPSIELVRNAKGIWNVSTLGGAQDESADSTLVLDRLIITGGVVGITDLQARPGAPAPRGRPRQAPRTEYRNIDLQLDGYAPRKAFDLVLSATLPAAGQRTNGGRVSVRGTAGPVNDADPSQTPFRGAVSFENASLAGLASFAAAEALDRTDAVITGQADVTSAAGRAAAKGTLTLNDARVHGVDLGYPVALTMDAGYAVASSLLTIASATVKLGPTPLALSGTVSLATDTPQVDLRVSTPRASLAEAARLASAFGVAFGADMQVAGMLDADVRAKGPSDAPALTGQVRLRNVSISGAGVPKPVTTSAVDLALTPSDIRTNDFTVTTNGTSVGVQATIGRYATTAPTVDASLRAANADVGDVLAIAHAWGVSAADGVTGSGRLSVNVRATGPTSEPRLSGSGGLADATLQTPSITQPIRVRSAALSFGTDTASLDNLSVSLGKTTATGTLTLRHFASPDVQFELSADRIDVVEMQALLAPSAAPAAAASGAAKSGVKTDAASQSPLLSTRGAGRLRVGSIVSNQLVIENVQASATIDRGVLRLDPLTAAVYGGRHAGVITVDARKIPATFSYVSTLEQVDANKLASAATSLRDVIFGALTSDVRMTASMDGAQQMARSMNGRLSLNVPDGRIANMDLMREISNIGRFVTGQGAAQRTTAVAALTGTFDVVNGLARTDDLKATIEGGTLGAAGTIDLADETVNLRLTAVMSKWFSDRVGGTKVGGFMTTALANQQGELVIPLTMTGTMSQPKFAPDAARVADMKLKSLVPNLRNPQQLTTGILGAITGSGAAGEEPRTGRQKLGDVLGAVTGRQRPAAQPEAGAPAPPASAAPPAVEPPAEDAAKPPAAAQPARTPGQQLQDRLRGLLRPKRDEAKPAPQPAPESEAQPAK